MGKSRPGTTAAKQAQTRTASSASGKPARSHRANDDALLALHRKAGNATVGKLVRNEMGLPAAVRAELAREGEPLDAGTRDAMESRFGEDFGTVRIHTDARAAESARALDAEAYTVGEDVVFGAGTYAPAHRLGRFLLAHELAHVVQQRRGGAAPALDPKARHERDASAAAASAAGGRARVTEATGIGIARAAKDKVKTLLEEEGPLQEHFPDDEAEIGRKYEADDVEMLKRVLHAAGYTEVYTRYEIPRTGRGAKKQSGNPRAKWLARTFPDARHRPEIVAIDPEGAANNGIPTILVLDVTAHAGSLADLKPGDRRPLPNDSPGYEGEKKLHIEKTIDDADQLARHLPRTNPKEAQFRVVARDYHWKTGGITEPQIVKRPGSAGTPPAGGSSAPGPGKPGGTPPGGGRPGASRPRSGQGPAKAATTKTEPKPRLRRGQGPAKAPSTEGKPASRPRGGASPQRGGEGEKAETPSSASPSKGSKPVSKAGAATRAAEGAAVADAPPVRRPAQRRGGKTAAPVEAGPTPVHAEAGAGHTGTAVATPQPASHSVAMKPVAPSRADAQPAAGKQPPPPTDIAKRSSPKPAPQPSRTAAALPPVVPAEHSPASEAGAPQTATPTTTAPPAPLPSARTPSPPKSSPTKTSARTPTAAAPAPTPETTRMTTPETGTESKAPRPPVRKPPPPPPTAQPPSTARATSASVASVGAPTSSQTVSAAGSKAAASAPVPETGAKPPPNLAPTQAQTQTKPVSPSSAETGPPDVSGQPTRVSKTTGNLAGVQHTHETTEQRGPVTRSTATKTSVGFGGISRTRETLRRDERGRGTSESTTTSVTRGEGRLGVGRTRTTQAGEFDPEGNLVKGKERTTHVGGGAIVGPEGAGLFGGASTETTTAHGRGITTRQSFGVNGEFLVDVKEVPGKTPPQYQVVLTISLGAHAGVGAGAGKGVTASVSGGVSGRVSGTFVHTFSEAEKEKYLGALASNGAGGAERELQVIALAAGGSMDEAKELLTTAQAGAMSAEAARTMTPGDSATFEAQGKAEAGAGLGATGKGGLGVGGEVSFSKSGTLRRTVHRTRDGRVVVTVEVVTETATSVGGKASYGAVGAGLKYGRTDTEGGGVSFELDPNDPNYASHMEEIKKADSIGELKKMAVADPNLVGATEESHGTSTTLTPSVSLAGVEAGISTTHAYGERTIATKEGQTREFSGSTGGGIDVGIQGGPKASYSQTQGVVTRVDPQKRARGDVRTTTSQTDFGGSLLKFGQGLEDKPIKTSAGLATGGTPLLQSHAEVTGMKLSDEDYGAIAARAEDSKAWGKAFHGIYNQSYLHWVSLGHRIQAAGGDREQIAKALAEYAHENDGASEAVQAAVRPSGTTAGGIRYDWPEELAAEQATFDELIVDDALAGSVALAHEGNFEEALGQMNADVGKLTALARKIESNQGKFSDATAAAEMLRRVGERLTAYRAEIRKLNAALKPGDEAAKSDKPTGDPAKQEATAETEDAQAKHDAANDQIGELVRETLTWREHEREVFAVVDKELNDPPWYRSTDVIVVSKQLTELQRYYEQWDLAMANLRAAYTARGDDSKRADQFAPDRAGWNQRNNHPTMTKYR